MSSERPEKTTPHIVSSLRLGTRDGPDVSHVLFTLEYDQLDPEHREALGLLRRAAQLEGLTVPEFIVEALSNYALVTVAELSPPEDGEPAKRPWAPSAPRPEAPTQEKTAPKTPSKPRAPRSSPKKPARKKPTRTPRKRPAEEKPAEEVSEGGETASNEASSAPPD